MRSNRIGENFARRNKSSKCSSRIQKVPFWHGKVAKGGATVYIPVVPISRFIKIPKKCSLSTFFYIHLQISIFFYEYIRSSINLYIFLRFRGNVIKACERTKPRINFAWRTYGIQNFCVNSSKINYECNFMFC